MPGIHLERIHSVLQLGARIRAEVGVAGAIRDVDLAPVLERVGRVRVVEDPVGVRSLKPRLGHERAGERLAVERPAGEDLVHVRRVVIAEVGAHARASAFEVNHQLRNRSVADVDAHGRPVSAHGAIDVVEVPARGGAHARIGTGDRIVLIVVERRAHRGREVDEVLLRRSRQAIRAAIRRARGVVLARIRRARVVAPHRLPTAPGAAGPAGAAGAAGPAKTARATSADPRRHRPPGWTKQSSSRSDTPRGTTRAVAGGSSYRGTPKVLRKRAEGHEARRRFALGSACGRAKGMSLQARVNMGGPWAIDRKLS